MNEHLEFPRTGGMRRALLLGGLALAATLGACGSRPPPPTQMDLGPAPAWPQQAPLAKRVELQAVTAAETLQGTGIAYRLADSDPYARRVYRDARWAAPLPVLVASRMRQQIARAPSLISVSSVEPRLRVTVSSRVIASTEPAAEPLGSHAPLSALLMIRTIAQFELIASLPPRRMTAFPLFKQSAAASEVTLGRLS